MHYSDSKPFLNFCPKLCSGLKQIVVLLHLLFNNIDSMGILFHFFRQMSNCVRLVTFLHLFFSLKVLFENLIRLLRITSYTSQPHRCTIFVVNPFSSRKIRRPLSINLRIFLLNFCQLTCLSLSLRRLVFMLGHIKGSQHVLS